MSADYDLREFFEKYDIASSFLFYDWPIPTMPRGWSGVFPPIFSSGSSMGPISISGSSGMLAYTGWNTNYSNLNAPLTNPNVITTHIMQTSIPVASPPPEIKKKGLFRLRK